MKIAIKESDLKQYIAKVISENYPLGAQYDQNAPWNQRDADYDDPEQKDYIIYGLVSKLFKAFVYEKHPELKNRFSSLVSNMKHFGIKDTMWASFDESREITGRSRDEDGFTDFEYGDSKYDNAGFRDEEAREGAAKLSNSNPVFKEFFDELYKAMEAFAEENGGDIDNMEDDGDGNCDLLASEMDLNFSDDELEKADSLDADTLKDIKDASDEIDSASKMKKRAEKSDDAETRVPFAQQKLGNASLQYRLGRMQHLRENNKLNESQLEELLYKLVKEELRRTHKQ